MDFFRLSEIMEHIQRVISLNFPDAFWLKAEVAQANTSRGHMYIHFVEKDIHTEVIKAQVQAAIWSSRVKEIHKRVGDIFQQIFQPGSEVLVKVRLDYHAVHGLKFIIEDVDTTFSLGVFEKKRQEILARLSQENRLELNRKNVLPLVIQRVAIISSPTAAGYEDFIDQIEENDYGYSYTQRLFPAAMQGSMTELEVCQQLEAIKKQKRHWDVVVIIRGGGSKFDLAWFDNYAICKVISEMPIPVITGIGHEIDESLCDLVAHTSMKTPTAVAEFLVQHNMRFESSIIQISQEIEYAVRNLLHQSQTQLIHLHHQLKIALREQIYQHQQKVHQYFVMIPVWLRMFLKAQSEQLEFIQSKIVLLDPKWVLKRGYSILTKNKKVITSVQQLNVDDPVIIQMIDGSVTASITKL